MKLISTLFNRRVRGFRVMEIIAGAFLVALVLSVYLTKAAAGREAAAIASVDRDIAEQERQVRLLKASLAQLEQPERLESLSTRYLSLAPVAPKRETAPAALAEVAHQAAATEVK
jgi:hypothetical protein